jgi:hypothetical protein
MPKRKRKRKKKVGTTISQKESQLSAEMRVEYGLKWV